MADSLKILASPRATLVYRETAATSSDPDDSGNNNVFDKVAPVLYGVKIDATSNPDENVYLCLYSKGIEVKHMLQYHSNF